MTMTRMKGNVQGTVATSRTEVGAGTLILLYHRVTTLLGDPQLLSVTPEHFAEHLQVLKRHARPVSLHTLAEGLRNGYMPSRSFAVTFDDGYADNLEQALPLLEAADVPATAFVVTGYMEGQRELWWDELEHILFDTECLPPDLSLHLSYGQYDFHLADATVQSVEARRRHRAWNVLDKCDPTGRHRLYRELFDLLRPMQHGQRREVLDALLNWSGQQALIRPSHRVLSTDQVAALADSGLVDVGAHTVTHPLLSSLPVQDQRSEIVESKCDLETVTGRSVTAFSYPFGTRHDYTQETVALVRVAGFGIAVANRRGMVRTGTDPFQLPRVLVRDWDADTLLRHLMETCFVA
jgi:peptidoglycan/xylan/chitin deacetylase (PgdA/CDA1 family)